MMCDEALANQRRKFGIEIDDLHAELTRVRSVAMAEIEALKQDAARYRWLKTATKEQLLAWRGVYGCSDMAIDEMLKN